LEIVLLPDGLFVGGRLMLSVKEGTAGQAEEAGS
jgi:hypothetical protein